MDVKKIVESLTLEEKAGLCSGADNWNTKPVERLGVPSIMVSDGPHGLRKQKAGSENQNLGLDNAIEAVCFPTASSLACSFDPSLLYEVGQAIGQECQAEDVAVILGPGINMKRSPLCGRNFEYFAEDPYLAGELGTGYVKGVQSKNVGTSLKHFAANNQETRRLVISSEVDERTLREIYLSAYEKVVKEAKPWTVMCSYNCINGTFSSENDWLLNKVLRDEWGYKGMVVSDWGAVNDRVKGIAAGLDLEMPASGGVRDAALVAAVKAGTLSEKVLDQAAERVLNLVERYESTKESNAKFDMEEHHELARRVESECAVLLKNEGILPLKKDQKVLYIGGFAKTPRYQGGGSSHINSFKVTNAYDSSENEFVLGFDVEQIEVDEQKIAQAVEAAKNVEVAVIFAGLPESFESEGFDRRHMELPECQNALIKAVAKVQPNTVVVLHNGSPITLPWYEDVKGVLEMYLGGQAVGEATVDILYGTVNPSGKLAETFPMRLQDNPSYVNFPGDHRSVHYGEGIFIGYRYYEKKDIQVRFPFGYGLSYTNFEYKDLKLVANTKEASVDSDGRKVLNASEADDIKALVTIKNVGNYDGKEIVQLYVHQKNSRVPRPYKELKGFAKVSLKAGEEKTVELSLDRRSFAYYDVENADWIVDTDEFEILVGASSADIRLSGTINMKGTQRKTFKITSHTLIGDLVDAVGDFYVLMDELKKHVDPNLPLFNELEVVKTFIYDFPVRSVGMFVGNYDMTDEMLENIVNKLISER